MFKSIVEAQYVIAKTKVVITPPDGHDDLGTNVLVQRGNKVQIMKRNGNVDSMSSQKTFDSPRDAADWITEMAQEYKKAGYKVT